MSTAEQIQAVKTMLGLAKFTKKRGLQAAAYRAAGLYLERLRHGRTKLEWVDIVRTCCLISERRAYELMALAKGKTLAEHRAATAARRRKHYQRKSKTSGKKATSEGADSTGLERQKVQLNQ